MSNSPPYSENHEAAVLGAILMKPDILSNGSAPALEDFYLDKHQWIFQAMLALVHKDTPTDPVNVTQELIERGKLEDVGGAFYLTGLPEKAALSIKADVGKLQELAVKRRVREQAIKMQQDIEAGLPLDEIEGAEAFTSEVRRESVLSAIMPQPMDIWLMDESTEERPADIISGILPAETVMLLYGVPKVGKSLLALGLGLHLAAGRPWFDLEINKSWKVLYISAEGGKWALIDRINRLRKGELIPAAKQFFFWAIPALDVLNPVDFGGLVAAIEGAGPDVIIMDPLQKLHRNDENDNSEMQQVLDRLRSLTTGHGRSMILLHHARKGGDASRGASSIVGEVDSVLRFEWESRDDHHGARRLYFEDLRHGEAPDDLYLNLDPSTLSFTREGSSNEAVQVLADNEGRMASRAALKDALMAYAGKKKDWAYRRIQLAIQSGQIEEKTKGGEIHLSSLQLSTKV